jgi:hypothetical protein
MTLLASSIRIVALNKSAEAGVDYVSSWVPPEDRDKVLADVEEWAKLIER